MSSADFTPLRNVHCAVHFMILYTGLHPDTLGPFKTSLILYLHLNFTQKWPPLYKVCVVDEYRDIRYAAYRTAFKIRHIQKRLKCKNI